MSDMKLIVGLGNPGEQYENTRHNLGFVVIEQFLKDFTSATDSKWEANRKLKGESFIAEWKPKSPDRRGLLEKLILLKPATYMNNSGMSVVIAKTFYKVSSGDIWIVHDDIDLPVGTIRIRKGGSSGGHKGIESVMTHLGTEQFWRFRLGIGHPVKISNIKNLASQRSGQKSKLRDVEEFVLQPFDRGEKGKVKHLIDHGAKAITAAIEHGLEGAMNSFNTR